MCAYARVRSGLYEPERHTGAQAVKDDENKQ